MNPDHRETLDAVGIAFLLVLLAISLPYTIFWYAFGGDYGAAGARVFDFPDFMVVWRSYELPLRIARDKEGLTDNLRGSGSVRIATAPSAPAARISMSCDPEFLKCQLIHPASEQQNIPSHKYAEWIYKAIPQKGGNSRIVVKIQYLDNSNAIIEEENLSHYLLLENNFFQWFPRFVLTNLPAIISTILAIATFLLAHKYMLRRDTTIGGFTSKK